MAKKFFLAKNINLIINSTQKKISNTNPSNNINNTVLRRTGGCDSFQRAKNRTLKMVTFSI